MASNKTGRSSPGQHAVWGRILHSVALSYNSPWAQVRVSAELPLEPLMTGDRTPARSAYGTDYACLICASLKQRHRVSRGATAYKVNELTGVHPRGRLKTLGCRVLAEGRHPRVLRPRFLPKVVEALRALLPGAHCYLCLILRRLYVAEEVDRRPKSRALLFLCCREAQDSCCVGLELGKRQVGVRSVSVLRASRGLEEEEESSEDEKEEIKALVVCLHGAHQEVVEGNSRTVVLPISRFRSERLSAKFKFFIFRTATPRLVKRGITTGIVTSPGV